MDYKYLVTSVVVQGKGPWSLLDGNTIRLRGKVDGLLSVGPYILTIRKPIMKAGKKVHAAVSFQRLKTDVALHETHEIFEE